MSPYIDAKTSDELIVQVREDQKTLGTKGTSSRKETVERAMIDFYLLRKADTFTYPVRVFHTTPYGTQLIPDFIIHDGEMIIGVEATQIANTEGERLERESLKLELKALQEEKPMRGIKNVTKWSVSSIEKETGKRPTTRELIDEAYKLPGQFPTSWVSVEEVASAWADAAKTMIERKTRLLTKSNYPVVHKSWLLLWDRLEADHLEELCFQKLFSKMRPASPFWDLIILESYNLDSVTEVLFDKEFESLARDKSSKGE
jgi:hypothetical protein